MSYKIRFTGDSAEFKKDKGVKKKKSKKYFKRINKMKAKSKRINRGGK